MVEKHNPNGFLSLIGVVASFAGYRAVLLWLG
jgi:hypothetical protein